MFVTGLTANAQGFYFHTLSTIKYILVSNGTSKYWSNGTYAASCYKYRNPPGGIEYESANSDGTYRIDPDGAGAIAPFDVYCDMTTEGGGYTYYPIDAGLQTYRVTDNNSCKALGMDIMIPRSKLQMTAVIAKYDSSYFATIPGVYKATSGGNYTGCKMRRPADNGGDGCADWQVADGGRWWLRDSTFSEPNGDYTAYCWLANWGMTDVNNISFNDGNCIYSTTKYICSTNDKP